MGIEVFKSKLLYPDLSERLILCTNDPKIGVSCVDTVNGKGRLAICVSSQNKSYHAYSRLLKSGGIFVNDIMKNSAIGTIPNESCPFYEDVSAFEQKETQKEEAK